MTDGKCRRFPSLFAKDTGGCFALTCAIGFQKFVSFELPKIVTVNMD